MNSSGFVLAGGQSTRMGRDKALLPFRGQPLAAYIASQVAAAAGTAVLIGPPERYKPLGWPVVADRRPGCGPLGGIETALEIAGTPWSLVVACDMPGLTAEFLAALIRVAGQGNGACLLPVSPAGLAEPLCAVYHKNCLSAVQAALDAGVRKVTDALSGLDVTRWPVPEPAIFKNLNTIGDWFATTRVETHG